MSIDIKSRVLELTPWQKKQAAMLYYFSSEEYLRKLHRMVYDLVNGEVEPLLDLAKAQGRDEVLRNSVWGDRDTVQNWANHGWPILKDLQLSLARTLAQRASNRFGISAVNECLRGIDEFSLNWATPGEEQMFTTALAAISIYASGWDDTVTEYPNQWDDFTFAHDYPRFAAAVDRIPKFMIRADVRSETGDIPKKTGVYFSPGEPTASLQFAWSEHGGVELRPANVLNELGLAALASVGRAALWFDKEKMLRFVLSEPLAQPIRHEVLSDGEPVPSLAPSAVARSAFTTKACSWMLVEPIRGEFESLEALSKSVQAPSPDAKKFAEGQMCTEPGFYFTPSSPNSRRYFESGAQMPSMNSTYGDTVWQRDADQRP